MVRIRWLWKGLFYSFLSFRITYNTSIRNKVRFLYGFSGIVSLLILVVEFGFNYPQSWNQYIRLAILGVVYYLVFYEILGFIFSGESWRKLIRKRPVELAIAFLVIAQRILADNVIDYLGLEKSAGDRAALIFLSVSQAFLLVNFLIHIVRNAQFSALLRLNPSLVFLGSFAFVIIIGTLLLSMPRSTKGDISYIDTFFITVSATCVTGLSPVDISMHFTRTGQTILLGLIQIGGLGLMTLTSFFSYFLTGRVSVQTGLLMKDLLSEDSLGKVRSLIKDIAFATFAIEGIGVIYLYYTTPAHMFDSGSERLFYSLFHSVSAFCNAGFSLYPDSMMRMNLTGHFYQSGIMVLIVFGGLGFPVISQLYKKIRNPNDYRTRLSVAARIVLWTNLVLFVSGFIAFLFLESPYTLAGREFKERIFHSVFFTVTARTAGFNSVDTAAMGIPLVFFSFLLMWIGASPASTGGGIKTSTFAVVIIHIFSHLMGRERVEIYKKTVSEASVHRAYTSVILSLMVIFVSLFILVTYEPHSFLDLAFEAVSAFGTVGLSRGITGDLSSVSKITLSIVMLTGRVGILTFLTAMLPQRRQENYRYPVEYVIVG